MAGSRQQFAKSQGRHSTGCLASLTGKLGIWVAISNDLLLGMSVEPCPMYAAITSSCNYRHGEFRSDQRQKSRSDWEATHPSDPYILQ